MELIKLGKNVDKSDLHLIVGLDNVVFVDFLITHMSIQDLWESSIQQNCYSIMDVLLRNNLHWTYDIRYATLMGNLKCIKFLMSGHGRVPCYNDVAVAVADDCFEILQYFRLFSKTNLKFQNEMWDECIVAIAIENGHRECLKFILKEDSNLWTPTVMIPVWECWKEMGILDARLQSDIVDCMRFIHDSSFSWPLYLCTLLLDDCTIVSCDTCTTQDMSFIVYRRLLQEHLGQFPEDIGKLLISFMCIYHKCDYCGSMETWQSNNCHLRCVTCKTTYFCSNRCQSLSWERDHKLNCLNFNLITE